MLRLHIYSSMDTFRFSASYRIAHRIHIFLGRLLDRVGRRRRHPRPGRAEFCGSGAIAIEVEPPLHSHAAKNTGTDEKAYPSGSGTAHIS
jgi:hypothetical protein